MSVWRCLLLALAAVVALASEGWHRPFSLLGPEQGLPAGGITTLAQEADGFLWVGTENGLLRYEGGASSRWSREEGLPSDYIHRLLAHPAGGLWVSTSRGLVWMRAGRVETALFDAPSPGQGVSSMALDSSGRLWVITPKGLFIQQRGTEFKAHPWTPPGRLLAIAQGEGGMMHLGTDLGLHSISPNGNIQTFGPPEGLPREGVALLVEDGDGRLWAGTGRHLAMKARNGQHFTDESGRLRGSLSPNSVPFRDPDGSIWFPTQAGALRANGPQTESVDSSIGLPFRWVRTVFRDQEGTLWILGPSLARLQGSGRVWNHSLAGSSSGEVVWFIHRDSRGRLLAATDDGAMRVSPTGVRRIPGTEGRRIKHLASDRSGLLWMVSTIGPTLWLRPGSTQAEIAPLGDLGYAVNSVMEDRKGTVWLGHTQRGLLRWDPVSRRLRQELGPQSGGGGTLGVYQVREDARGRLWAATTAGLRLKDTDGQWRSFGEAQGLPPCGFWGLAFLPDGTAWLHFSEALGLVRVRVEGDRLTVIEHRVKGQGLHSNLVYAVAVDELGQTWATTDQGLDRLDPFLHVGRREGMISEDCAILALLAEAGRVWVGTAGGLVRFESDTVEPERLLPAAHILKLHLGDRQLAPPFEHLPAVSARESTVAFRVAAPSYRLEGQFRIQGRLLGLESGWRDLDSAVARYPALPGGSYRFETRTLGPDGRTGAASSLSFKVQPPWWKSWWALSLEVLLCLLALSLLVRVRIAGLARSKAELEALVARRTEELRARNEELSTALVNVKQLSGLLPICASCKKIRDDKGYWNQLEQYISAHSEVGFSHGICPDCVETVFPEYVARRSAQSPIIG